MRDRTKFGAWLTALGIGTLLVLPATAQRRQNDRPPRAAPRQERQAERQPQRQQERPPQVNPPNARNDRPPREAPNFAPGRNDAGQNARPQRDYAIPQGAARWQDRLRNMPPEARDRFLQNNEKFRSMPREQQQKILNRFQKWDRLTPEQKQRVVRNENVWRELTPGQRQHLRNDVLPKWEQMPSDRRQAIQQRLRILQNMPEDARDRRLADPNFTRGMSEQDKDMLRDLSHTHIGAPDRPPNQ
jgi:Protein of unknown function (DUF3106)